MNASLRTQAIILRRTNYGEADRILQLLTPSGRQAVIARGVRREKSKLAGGIELFAISDVVIGRGKGDLGILTAARLVQFFGQILKDYERLQFAYEALKMTAHATEQFDGGDWFYILSETLSGLDNLNLNFSLIKTWFYLHAADLLGHELSLVYDSVGNKLDPGLSYNYDWNEKSLKLSQKGSLSAEHIKLLRLIAAKPLKNLAQIGGIESVVTECLSVARQHAVV